MSLPLRCPTCGYKADWDEHRVCRNCRVVLPPLALRGMTREDWANYVGLSVQQLELLGLERLP